MKLLKPINARYFELGAIIVTGIAKYVLVEWLGMRAFFITGTCLFWIWYVAYRYSYDHSVLKNWGFNRTNLLNSWKIMLPFMLVATAISVMFALNNNISIFNFHIIPILLLYPLWGIIQQFIFLSVITLNLQKFRLLSKDRLLLVVAASGIFSLIHFPYYYLMAFAFLMEILFVYVFLKWRNIWTIGLAHGWAATFFLYYVMDRDLWTEFFAWF